MVNKKRVLIFSILSIIFVVMIVVGLMKNDISLIEQFGKFLCLDCIGIS
ncbi:MAG: hypothetical protein SVK54_07505 [candidate division WOR-3 bacterium]|nr:hypothetical protein [candidate division WOR-3 bacterium]